LTLGFILLLYYILLYIILLYIILYTIHYYYYILLLHTILFSSSDLFFYIPFQHSLPVFPPFLSSFLSLLSSSLLLYSISSQSSHSFYTCRFLYILTYILYISFIQSHLPSSPILTHSILVDTYYILTYTLPSFILYLSGLIYTYLYSNHLSSQIPHPHVLRCGWLRCVVCLMF